MLYSTLLLYIIKLTHTYTSIFKKTSYIQYYMLSVIVKCLKGLGRLKVFTWAGEDISKL